MATVRNLHTRGGWFFGLVWVIANAVAGAVTMAVTGVFVRAISLNAAWVVAVFGIMIGSALGGAQWLVLRRRIPQAYLWVAASVVGGSVLAVLGFAMGGAVGGPLGGSVVGAALGITQWLVLRRRVSQAYIYIPASIIGYALAFLLGEMVGFTIGGTAGWLVGGAIVGSIAGIVTGSALVYLLRRTISDI